MNIGQRSRTAAVRRLAQIAVAATFICLASDAAQAAAKLEGLGFDQVTAVSGDGRSAVGREGADPVIWRAGRGAAAISADGTLVDLTVQRPIPVFAGQGDFWEAFVGGISFDGSVVVGETLIDTPNPNLPADDYTVWRWTAGSGAQFLDTSRSLTAQGVSADGSVVVVNQQNGGGYPAHTWTEQGGLQRVQTIRSSLTMAYVHAVSGSGNVVVGFGIDRAHGNGLAARWGHRGIAQSLGDLPGGLESSEAFDVSADGRVVVGLSQTSGKIDVPFRWTNATGMLPLRGFPHGFSGRAVAVSADGSVILGNIDVGSRLEPFLWDKPHGVRKLGKILENAHVEMGDWKLGQAVDLSADGKVIVGEDASGSRAWIVDLHPQPVIAQSAITALPEPGVLPIMTATTTFLLGRRRGNARLL